MKTEQVTKVPISPKAFLMMQTILAEWCVRKGVSLNSQESLMQAKQIVTSFESGCFSETQLREAFLPPALQESHCSAQAARPCSPQNGGLPRSDGS